MRRFVMVMSLALTLVLTCFVGASAQQISIVGDPGNPDMPVDISLRDADLTEVLTALFNTTNGKYQLSILPGVAGRVARLQISTSFEKALDTILGSEYSYVKDPLGDGKYLYKISGRTGSTPSPMAPTTPLMAPPSASLPAGSGLSGSKGSSTAFPSLTYSTKSTTAQGTTAGAAASTESVIKPIKISYMSIESFTEALGGNVVYLFENTGSGGGSRRSGGGGRSSRDSGYDDDDDDDRDSDRDSDRSSRDRSSRDNDRSSGSRNNDRY